MLSVKMFSMMLANSQHLTVGRVEDRHAVFVDRSGYSHVSGFCNKKIVHNRQVNELNLWYCDKDEERAAHPDDIIVVQFSFVQQFFVDIGAVA